jgi:outer membrane biosynthesis protein TonB
MKKKYGWMVSVGVCLAVIAVMIGAGLILLSTDDEMANSGSKVEAAPYDLAVEDLFVLEEPQNEFVALKKLEVDDAKIILNEQIPAVTASPQKQEEQPPKEKPDEQQTIKTAAKPPVDYRAENDTAEKKTQSMPVEAQNEEPAASPADNPVTASETQIVKQHEELLPLTYTWGAVNSYTFRIEVKITNNGNDTARNVIVSVPLLENDSPYQTTTLKSVNYDIESSTGRNSSFNIGELAPGETKSIVADFTVNVKAVSINSTNDTVEKARIAYEQYAGSGNCRTLALGFINKSRELGITAREVIGFARPERGAMTSGSLQGYRHSWAEFYAEGLGWVPVDLTFQYFGTFPTTSHIVESYSDQSIKITYLGGNLSASWNNVIL